MQRGSGHGLRKGTADTPYRRTFLNGVIKVATERSLAVYCGLGMTRKVGRLIVDLNEAPRNKSHYHPDPSVGVEPFQH